MSIFVKTNQIEREKVKLIIASLLIIASQLSLASKQHVSAEIISIKKSTKPNASAFLLKKQNVNRFFVVGSKSDFKVGDKIVLKQNGSMRKI